MRKGNKRREEEVTRGGWGRWHAWPWCRLEHSRHRRSCRCQAPMNKSEKQDRRKARRNEKRRMKTRRRGSNFYSKWAPFWKGCGEISRLIYIIWNSYLGVFIRIVPLKREGRIRLRKARGRSRNYLEDADLDHQAQRTSQARIEPRNR